MAALTADVNASTVGSVDTDQFSANAPGDVFYRGSIVYIDTGGGVQVTAAAGDRILGVSPKNQVTTAAGQLVSVITRGDVWLPTSLAVTVEGELAINDGPTDTDNPADMVNHASITIAAGDAVLGRVLRIAGGQMLVRIGDYTGTIGVATGTAFLI